MLFVEPSILAAVLSDAEYNSHMCVHVFIVLLIAVLLIHVVWSCNMVFYEYTSA